MPEPTDVLIVGAGVVGLSLAYELTCAGASVRVIDSRPPGTQASWAAAGIIPAVCGENAGDSFRKLEALSGQLYSEWAAHLAEVTGIDVEYRRCGSITLARSPGEAAALAVSIPEQQSEGAIVRAITQSELSRLEPDLALESIRAAYFGAKDAQVRPPRLIEALLAACRKNHVRVDGGIECLGWQRVGNRLSSVQTSSTRLSAGAYCLAAGPWSGGLLKQLDLDIETRPWRGQVALLRGRPGTLRHMIHEGPNYLVPRDDGHVVVGSTMEDVGFETGTSDEAIGQLVKFAVSLMPKLADAPLQARWSRFRPGSVDGWPYVDRIPGLENAYVATGHLRFGIALAPATARLVRQLIEGRPPDIDLEPFRLTR